MKRVLLIASLLFFAATIVFISLTYFSDYNLISLLVLSVIGLSGFSLSYSNYSLSIIGKSNTLILLFSVLIFASSFFGFYNKSWFEMTWNFNLAGHVLVLFLALFQGVSSQHWIGKIVKFLLVFCGLACVVALSLKFESPLFFSVLSVVLPVLMIGVILIQIAGKRLKTQ